MSSRILLDIDDNVVQVPTSITNGSRVLKAFFDINPDKAYKLEYPIEVISKVISLLKGGENIMLSDPLVDLCNHLEIGMINHYIEDSGHFQVEQNVVGKARYIFDSIFLMENRCYHKKRSVRSTEPHATGLNNNDNREIILKSYDELSNFTRMNRGTGNEKVHCFGGTDVTTRFFNVGQLVNDKLRDIKMDGGLLDQVANLLAGTYSKYDNLKPPSPNGQYVVEIQKDYGKYIIKLKIIRIKCLNFCKVMWDPNE
jgi:hypothetical protein